MKIKIIKAPSSKYAFGGDLQSNSSDFSTGLIHIDAGGSHSENPNDGVQMGVDSEGTPNLVEEGETVFNDYVYSTRILADEETKKKFHLPKKKDITYAEISKKLEKEIAERPNDPISQAGFKAQMETLANEQERQKQEMEAERAKAAFEALSPEEQTAIMQRAAQEEQMAQQAAQEQAIAEQQAAMQQPSPEEAAMMQQQMMQADGSQAALGQQAPMMAYGGKVNRFDLGGDIMKMLGKHTWSEFVKWAKENKAFDDSSEENSSFWDGVEGPDGIDWEVMLATDNFRKALSKDNPALADALGKGYDFGAYKPLGDGKATIKSISKGNWKATNGLGWLGSDDPAWLEAVKYLSEDDIKKLSTKDVAKLMRATPSYKKGSEWLQNKDNALLYLNTLMNDPDTPKVAKDYAAKFVKDGQWKDGFNYDYATVFGSNGRGVRETNPGTYWHTPVEATRGNMTRNMVINDDGTVEEIIGDIPTDWTGAGNYSWATPENDLTYNYYRRPAAAPDGEVVATTSPQTPPEDDRDMDPDKRPSWLRYAGLFGPAVGLGMQALGIGRPDTSGIDAAIKAGNGPVALAEWMPRGDFARYQPNDPWFYTSPIMAQSNATQRAINNKVSPSKGAETLANSYNTMVALGNAQRQQLDSNFDRYMKVKDFNGNIFESNAQRFDRNSQFNADARNRAKQYAAQLAMQGAAQKMDADAGWYNGIYGNVAGLFKGLGDIGLENERHNTVSRMAANGIFGNATPDTPVFEDFIKWQKEQNKEQAKKSKGGKNHKKHDIIL